MRQIALALTLALLVAGCARIPIGVIEQAATATVPASAVIPAANAFDILKGTATNYARYCVANRMPVPLCSVDNRRKVVKFVNSGAAVRDQLEDSVISGRPALASVYNVLVAAVQGLQGTPAAAPQFGAR